MGGHIQGRLWPRDEADAAAIRASGRDPARILYTDDLVRGNDVSPISTAFQFLSYSQQLADFPSPCCLVSP
jgi:fructose-1,6-bisphosphatase/sedoheptulose 1,7-bisphosphatase-like protein